MREELSVAGKTTPSVADLSTMFTIFRQVLKLTSDKEVLPASERHRRFVSGARQKLPERTRRPCKFEHTNSLRAAS